MFTTILTQQHRRIIYGFLILYLGILFSALYYINKEQLKDLSDPRYPEYFKCTQLAFNLQQEVVCPRDYTDKPQLITNFTCVGVVDCFVSINNIRGIYSVTLTKLKCFYAEEEIYRTHFAANGFIILVWFLLLLLWATEINNINQKFDPQSNKNYDNSIYKLKEISCIILVVILFVSSFSKMADDTPTWNLPFFGNLVYVFNDKTYSSRRVDGLFYHIHNLTNFSVGVYCN